MSPGNHGCYLSDDPTFSRHEQRSSTGCVQMSVQGRFTLRERTSANQRRGARQRVAVPHAAPPPSSHPTEKQSPSGTASPPSQARPSPRRRAIPLPLVLKLHSNNELQTGPSQITTFSLSLAQVARDRRGRRGSARQATKTARHPFRWRARQSFVGKSCQNAIGAAGSPAHPGRRPGTAPASSVRERPARCRSA